MQDDWRLSALLKGVKSYIPSMSEPPAKISKLGSVLYEWVFYLLLKLNNKKYKTLISFFLLYFQDKCKMKI